MSPTHKIPALLLSLLVLIASPCLADNALTLANPGFEDGQTGWTWSPEDSTSKISQVVAEAASTGKLGLRVLVHDGEQAPSGSSVTSDKLPITPGGSYQLKFHARCNEKSGMGVIMLFFNDKYSIVSSAKQPMPTEIGGWNEYTLEGAAPADAAYVAIFIHSWGKNTCNVDLDDFSLTKIDKAGK